ncbi:hypothetical protein QWZ04_02670 [Vibrio tapetis subsp. quintayensis]|uniref:hypothetical protein n=1 Tax=Vibrio tapetis TaxID=52443 RepID=UPI0025B3B1DF|nr:hypothetical protein [Vibrio tapetis]MDN3679230.1 hypothetical protein [Vibrio tapetis subsp. quintayensis]
MIGVTLIINGSVLLKLDDSGGYRASLEVKIFEMITRSFSNVDWQDAQKVDWLIKSFEQDSEFGLFPTIPADFNLTDDQLALFYAKCEARLSSYQLENKGLSELSVYGLSMILIERAEALGEWREVVRLKGRIADQYFEFLALCEICLAHDEEFDAEDWLVRAKKVASDGYELTQCAKMEVKVLVALGDNQKAWDLAWENYVKRPELDAYKEVESMLSGINGSDFNLFEHAQSILISGHKTGQTGTHRFGFYSELLALYIHLEKWDLAIAWFDDEQGAVELGLKLAQSITAIYPETSGRIYVGIAAKQVAMGSKQSYQEAAKVLRDAENHLLETNQGEAIMKVIVASLIEHYKHKRNMMLILSNEFSSYCP